MHYQFVSSRSALSPKGNTIVRVPWESNVVSTDIDELHIQAEALQGADCLDIGDLLAYCKNPHAILEQLRAYCASSKAGLVLSIPNAMNRDYIARQFFAVHQLPEAKRHLTLAALEEVLGGHGFQLLKVYEERISDSPCLNQVRDLNGDYANSIDFFSDLTPISNTTNTINVYCELSENAQTTALEQPFLSVIVRTVGNRLNELKEVFLCLNAQTDKSFEVLLMLHKVEQETRQQIEALIADLLPEEQARIRIIPVSNGNRSTPLNVAIEAANGHYFAVLDDDDLVMGDWIEAFENGASLHPGFIIHSNCISQMWSKTSEGYLRAESAYNTDYCADFSWEKQFNYNNCPFMTLAFPTERIRNLKYRFNEQLDTTEDWDFLMRVASVLHVHDTKACTAIYRIWTNAVNSYSSYSESSWRKTEANLRSSFSSILRISSASELIESHEEIEKREQEHQERLTKTEHELWWNNQRCCGQIEVGEDTTDMTICFEKPYVAEKPGILRIDPFAFGGFRLLSTTITLYLDNGNTLVYQGKQIKTNGIRSGDEICFYFTDPQLSVHVPSVSPTKVKVHFHKHADLSFKKGLVLMPRAYAKLIVQTLLHPLHKLLHHS